MTGKTLTEAQIDKSTTTFVDDFCNANVKDSEITLIIAGLTAIIEENESAMQKMKEQKWFQRIWYTLTGKNRVEVEEMKAKRDELSKYTIRLLVKMNQKLGDQTVLIDDLYRSLSIVRNDVSDLHDVVSDLHDVVDKLARKLISVDKYHNVLNDIRNGRFNPDKALISLIEIMSLIDRRTAGGTDAADRFKRIRETMEKSGFDFASEINVQKHAEDVFSLPEEKAGSIYLFCQSCSNISKYLAYTCRLIENYFYCGETDRREALESGEAVNEALKLSGLRTSSNCMVSSMYHDLKEAVVTQAKEADIIIDIHDSESIILQGTPQKEISTLGIEQKTDPQKEDETTSHMGAPEKTITEVKITRTDIQKKSALQPEQKCPQKKNSLSFWETLGVIGTVLFEHVSGVTLFDYQMDEIRSYPDSCIEENGWLYYCRVETLATDKWLNVFKVKSDGTQNQQIFHGKKIWIMMPHYGGRNFRIQGNALYFTDLDGSKRMVKI